MKTIVESRTVLTVTAGISLVGLLVALVGLAVDHQMITGAPAWLKPAKFGVSITLYAATLGWFLSMVRGHPVAVRLISWSTAAALVVELGLISMQVIRGTTSHFNATTPFDAAVFETMGAFISVVFLAAAGTAVLLLRERSVDPVLGSGIRGGLLVALVGMAEAGLMLAVNAHTIGAPDGGPGLPVLGWSTEHGDLRAAHFVGLHGLQALPLLAWALVRYGPPLTEAARIRLVRLATGAFIGLVAVLAWQAERGLPLLRPDVPVGLALAALFVISGVVASAVVRAGRVRS